MEVKKLDFGETLKDSVAIGVKNAPSVIAAVALWLITIWIPYLNVGTTIAITLLPTQLAKGEIVNPLGIFDSKYRRYMGEFFITMGLMIFPIFIGVLFMVIPGICSRSHGRSPTISSSKRAKIRYRPSRLRTTPPTAANGPCSSCRWSSAYCSASYSAFSRPICNAIGIGFITFVVMFILYVLAISISMSISASFWKQLKDNVE